MIRSVSSGCTFASWAATASIREGGGPLAVEGACEKLKIRVWSVRSGELDDKVCVEGMFTIVLHSMKLDGKYVFATNTDGLDVTKSPIGMFDEEYIENDIQLVINSIRDYYKA
jgi:hypothetical protein